MKPLIHLASSLRREVALFPATIVIVLCGHAAHAATWDGGSTTSNLPSDPANWVGDVLPGAGGNLNGLPVDFGALNGGMQNTMNYNTGGNSGVWTFLASAPAMFININSNQFGAATGPNVFVNNSSFTQTFTSSGTPLLFNVGTNTTRVFDANTAAISMPGFAVRADSSPAVWNIDLKGSAVGSVSTGAWAGAGGSLAGKTIGIIKNGTGSWDLQGAIANIGAVAGTAVTVAQGTLTLAGANTYTGLTSVNGGTLKAGSATAFTSKGALALAGTGTFDLNGNNSAFTEVSASTTTSKITNNGPSAATLAVSLQSNTISSLITDGTSTLGFKLINNNSGVTPFLTNSASTFSGNLTLAYDSVLAPNGTRLRISTAITTAGSAGAITSSPFGTGAIIIGLATTNKAQVLLDTVPNNTLVNALLFNTALGTDAVGGVRVDTLGNTLSGTITANLANARFNVVGGVSLTGQITSAGNFGLQHDVGVGTVTLNNATANANNYSGDTTVGTTTVRSILTLGRANQLPDGAGRGNVVLNGTLDLGGFSETINGLTGTTGIVDGTSGTPTLTTGNNNASSTFGGVIKNTAGTLALTKTGSGTLTLSGSNTYSGATTLSSGTLKIGNASALGTQTGTADGTTITSGATLDLGGIGSGTSNQAGSVGAERITASGAGVGGNGAILSSTAIPSNFIGVRHLILAGDTTLGFTNRWDVGSNNASLPSSLTGGGFALNFIGSGTGQAAMNNLGDTDLGDININLGSAATALLYLQGTTALGRAAGTVSITGGSGLVFNGTVASFDKKFALDNGIIRADQTIAVSLPGTINLTNANTITAGTGAAITASGIISGGGSFTKTGGGILTLSNANNTYSGATTISAGTLSAGSSGNLGDAASNLVLDGGTLQITGTALTSFSGIGHSVSFNAGKTVGLNIAEPGNTFTVDQVLNQTTGGLTKQGAGSLVLNQPNTYSGTTTVQAGTLRLVADQSLAGALVVGVNGSATTAAIDSALANSTFGSLTVQTNSSTANIFNIGIGKTMTVNGNVQFGNTTSTGSLGETSATFAGGGALVVNAGTFNVGQNIGTVNNSAKAIVDFSALASFTANLGAGTLSIQPNGDNGGAAASVLRLSDTQNMITAANLTIGASSTGAIQTLVLGAGTNFLNVDSVRVGTGGRDAGVLKFASTGGSITLRNAAGTGRANVTMGITSAATTAYTTFSKIDTTGNTADLAIGTLAMDLGAKTGANTTDLLFDNGTLDILTINMAVAKGTGSSNHKITIGGGEVRLGGSTQYTDAGTGSLSLATAANGELAINGGTVTSTVDIGRATGGGTATLTLNGGTLDLTGHNIGGAAAINILNFQAGTLSNVAQINNGTSALNKTGLGTLILSGTNSYSGATTVSNGTLLINGNMTTATGAVSVASGATLGGSGTVGGATTISANGIHAPGNSVGSQSFSGDLTYVVESIFSWNLDAPAPDPIDGSVNKGTYDTVAVTGALTGEAVFKVVLGLNNFSDAFWDTAKSWDNIFTSGGGSDMLSTIFTSFSGSGVASNGVVLDQGQFTFTPSSNTLQWSAVPEPSSALAGLLLAAGLLRRRRVA